MIDARPVKEQLRERFQAAPTYEEYFENARELRDLWEARDRRASLPDDIRHRLAGVDAPRHLLALTYDGCGDGVDLLPWVARLAEASPRLELRVVERDENLDLMDAHLTDGRSRSVPVVIVLDENFREVGWWGPRPRELQEWVTGPGAGMDSQDRYRKVRGWYARDRGRTTLEELLDLLEATVPVGR